MTSNRVKLTDSFCKKAPLKPGQQATVYTDTVLPGFCLVVSGNPENPHRSLAVRYTLRRGDEAGTKRRVVLGPFPGKSVAEYREIAERVRGEAAQGVDEKVTDRANRAAHSMGDLCERYLRIHAAKKRSGAADRRRLDKYVLPEWRHRKAKSITRGEIAALVDDIAHGQKNQPGRPYEANRVLALIKKLFSFGISKGMVAAHPCVGMEKPGHEEAGTRELTKPEDLGAFWKLTGPDYQHLLTESYAEALRFILRTGCRPGEVLGMSWTELDLAAKEWLLPAARSKNGRAHLTPLTAEMVEMIEQRQQTSFYVFAAQRGGRLTDRTRARLLERTLIAFAEDGNKLERFTPRDLRRTAETAMAASGVAKEYRDRVLNHVDSSVGGKHYNAHDYKVEKRAALEKLARWIDVTLSIKPENKVLKFPTRSR